MPTKGTPVDFAMADAYGLTHAFPDGRGVRRGRSRPPWACRQSRARTIIDLSQAVADGKLELDPGVDREAVREQLVSMRGIGPWTADYIAMRALAHPDILLTTDLVLQRELERRGITAEDTERWRPWRSYAGMHLWRATSAYERTPA